MLIQLKKNWCQPIIVLISMIFFLSCQKELTNNIPATDPSGEIPDLSSKVNSSVSGFVTDENNDPVWGAFVQAGLKNTTTDKYGYFEIKNTDVVKTAAVVTVTQPGYFKGVKTYGAVADKAAFFRIKLIPKTTAGTIDASSGGNINLANGLIVTLPANGVVVASNNAAYTGAVKVAANWINPEATDLTEIMPGDLRGIDNEGLLKKLTTYGMAAVELTGTSGEFLQIAAGKKATITMPLSSLLSSAAPASIPLWYFDENMGLWKQDGSATKTGNTYVGEVSHFSYWNCDLPNATVPLTFTVVDAEGNPVGGAHVEIVPTTAGSWSHIGGYTDPSGYVSVFVTPNNSYSLQIYSNCSYYSGTPDYSQTFSVTTTAVDLGNIVIGSAATATVSGTITDCNNNPVTNGYILVQNGYYYSRYAVDNTGSYHFSSMLCSGTIAVTLVAEDITAAQQSTPVTQILVAGENAIGNIQACGVMNAEFINYTISGGQTVLITSPGDSLYEYTNATGDSLVIYGNSYSTSQNFLMFSINNAGISAGSVQHIGYIYISGISDELNITTPIAVNITEYGSVGEYIAGNFSGTLTGMPPANTQYPISCSFRVRRNL